MTNKALGSLGLWRGGVANRDQCALALEARLTPTEYVGYLKAMVIIHNEEASRPNEPADTRTPFEIAMHYQTHLAEYESNVGGREIIFPQLVPPTFWDADGVEYPSEDELIACADTNSIIVVNSSAVPHLRWAINVWGEDDGSEAIFFDRYAEAKSFHDGMLEEMAKVARNEAARNRRQNAKLKRDKAFNRPTKARGKKGRASLGKPGAKPAKRALPAKAQRLRKKR